MEPSQDNSQRNASQSPSVGASALEASTTPNHPTQACARSRSAGRNGTADGSGAVDDRRPQRLRQPAIDAAPMDASAVEASTAPPNHLRGDVPAFAPRASSVASADSQANSNPLDEWNARLNSYGGYGGGVVALEASRGFQSQGQQQWAAQPYGYGGYGIQAGYSQAQYYGGSSQQQPPYGHRYTDTSGSHWMWNPYNCSYEPDLAEEAAGHSLPCNTGSLYSQSAGSLNVAMQNMQAGPGTWQVSAIRAAHTLDCP